MERIYTRRGDAGDTGLFGGGRVPKDHRRVEAYGAVDELSAVLGVAIASLRDPDIEEGLRSVQEDLFALGAHLATPPTASGDVHPSLPPLPSSRVEALESWIDRSEDALTPLRAFILPGGSPGGAALHLARTVCRRAERRVVTLAKGGEGAGDVDPDIVVYLNRLSDLLFVLARLANHRAGAAEVQWRPRSRG